MSRMVRSKKEWICTTCSKAYLKWQGFCSCGAVGTLEEKVLIQPKPTASNRQRALIRRSKRSERTIAKRMVEVDGPDPEFAKIASSTGRTGHITGLRMDAVSSHYRIEDKNRLMPQWFIKAWVLINQRAIDFNKYALLHLNPPNMPKDFPLNGQRYKLDTIACITQSRHEDLIMDSARLRLVSDILYSDLPIEEKIQKMYEIWE